MTTAKNTHDGNLRGPGPPARAACHGGLRPVVGQELLIHSSRAAWAYWISSLHQAPRWVAPVNSASHWDRTAGASTVRGAHRGLSRSAAVYEMRSQSSAR